MPHPLRIIMLLCLISSLARFALDSYLPSLPSISEAFGVSNSSAQMTLTLYLLGFSLSQLVYGPLSDHYGRRLIISIGLGIFFLGSLCCALAASPNLLLAARFVAGIGAGACGVLNRAIASDCFKGAEFAKAWSYTTTTLVITLCMAPLLGGYIQEFWGWRANFLLSTLFVGSVFATVLKCLPETHLREAHPQSKTFTIREVWQNYKIIFVTPSFLNGAVCYALAFSGLIAYFQVSPILLIESMKLSPSEYGWCSLIIALTYLIGGSIVRRFVDRISTHRFLMIGALFLIAGGVLMWIIDLLSDMQVITFLLPAAIFVIGARIVIPNAIASSMANARHLNGSSSALIGCIQMLGSSFVSFAIALFDNTSMLPLAIFLTGIGCITLCLSYRFHFTSPYASSREAA